MSLRADAGSSSTNLRCSLTINPPARSSRSASKRWSSRALLRRHSNHQPIAGRRRRRFKLRRQTDRELYPQGARWPLDALAPRPHLNRFDATDIEHYALRYAAKEAGVSNVHFINKGFVAILGAGVDPADQRATLVVDVGAGTTTIAAMVHNRLIFTRTLRVGGNELDAALIEMIKQNHNLLVGPRTAERVKIELAAPSRSIKSRRRWSKDARTVAGNPDMAIINSIEVHDALEPVLAKIARHAGALEALPPEASGDIYDRGMILAGGGSLLAGFDERLTKETELAVQLTESPARAVVRGLGLLFEDPLMLWRAIVKGG